MNPRTSDDAELRLAAFLQTALPANRTPLQSEEEDRMARTIGMGLIALWLVASIVSRPEEAFQAALQGVSMWWNIVFPGLLPFLVLAELMLAFGLVHGLSALLGPAMRHIAGLPGISAWPLVLGWTAGYTAGAEACARLRARQELTRSQSQWLLAVSSMPNPMFMLIVIGAGFLHQPAAGLLLACTVWLSALLCGVLLRLAQPARSCRPDTRPPAMAGASSAARSVRQGLLRQAGQAMLRGRREDGRSFGSVLGDAVSLSIQKLLQIGGFIIFGALVVRLLALSLPEGLSLLAFPGIYESHLGAYSASLLQAELGTALCVAVAASILAWGGWSGLLQIRSALQGTDLRFAPFVWARLLHAALAFGTALLLWKPFHYVLQQIEYGGDSHVFWAPASAPAALPLPLGARELPSLWAYLPAALGLLAGVMLLLAAISAILQQISVRKSA